MKPKSWTFERTHPWLSFQLDLRKMPVELWLQLGAIQAKCEEVANALLRPDLAQDLHTIYLAKGVHATTAIEGNTLSEAQVQAIIERKLDLPKSKEYLQQEVENVVAACREIADTCLSPAHDGHLSRAQILRFNELVLHRIPVESHVMPGQIRRCEISVADYRGPTYPECDHLVDRLVKWLPQIELGKPELEIASAVLRAIVCHLYIAWIHPFGDGNGRTARLAEVQILMSAGVPMVSAHLLSNFYNETRAMYYRQLAQASKSGGNLIPFVQYAVQGLLDQLTEQIEKIQQDQREIMWRHLVNSVFLKKTGEPARRQQMVALELGRLNQPLSIDDILEHFSSIYGAKSGKTIGRDLETLHKLGLILIADNSVRANLDFLKTLLPKRRQKPT